MFTGIIEEIGSVEAVRRSVRSLVLTLRAPLAASDAAVGDSIAINGVCLTIVSRAGDLLSFDAVAETVSRSNLSKLVAGDVVNVERALVLGKRMGGHFVQGHVDGMGVLRTVEVTENARVLSIDVAAELREYLVEKCSVALDGVSLTVAGLTPGGVTVWVIPHTFAATTFHVRRPGDALNVEVDLLAKYVESLVRPHARGISEATLADAGFLEGMDF